MVEAFARALRWRKLPGFGAGGAVEELAAPEKISASDACPYRLCRPDVLVVKAAQ
jgi:hypothetical protein